MGLGLNLFGDSMPKQTDTKIREEAAKGELDVIDLGDLMQMMNEQEKMEDMKHDNAANF